MSRAIIVALTALVLSRSTSASNDASRYIEAAPACAPERAYCFSVHLHVADNMIEPRWIAQQIAMANHHFAEVGASFKIVKVDTRTMDRVDTIAERAALKKYVTGRTIHVFITNRLQDVDLADHEIRGVTLKKDDTKYIILSAIAPDRVLAHELGHLFGLPHSTYAVSIMNKTDRNDPPFEQRTFAPEEIEKLKAGAKRLVRAKVLSAK